ncbi:MAG: hypothetical protein V8T12_09150 [Parabacteroides johnsonii]
MKTAYQHTEKGQSCFLRAGLLMLLVLFCSVSGWAAKQESIKKKEINKSFNVGKNDILPVDNRYGNITVTHWSKSEVSIRVVMRRKPATRRGHRRSSTVSAYGWKRWAIRFRPLPA